MTPEEPANPAASAPPTGAAPYPFWSYHDLVVMMGLSAACLFGAFLLAMALGALLPDGASKRPSVALVSQFALWAGWLLCLRALFRTRYDQPLWRSLRWVRVPRGMAPYILLGVAQAFTLAILGVVLQAPNIEMPLKELLGGTRVTFILLGAFAVTVAPVCEELAFRGFLLPLLTRSFGMVAGLVVSSLAFALMHGYEYAWSWRHLLLLTAAGAGFGAVRLLTGSTAAAAAMHAGYNFVFFIAILSQWEEFAS